jgi:hypothetical protein
LKLYRYRPIGSLLYKELLYDELYPADFKELNDPIDLNAEINFQPRSTDDAYGLLNYLCILSFQITNKIEHLSLITNKNDVVRSVESFEGILRSQDVRSVAGLRKTLSDIYAREPWVFPFLEVSDQIADLLENEIGQITQNSRAVCFSQRKDNLLMWSHYGGGHNGICLEFSLKKTACNTCEILLQYILKNPDHQNKIYFPISYKEKIKKVIYGTRPVINFHDLLPVVCNLTDIDVIEISKDQWRSYANNISDLYLQKGLHWKYEAEWRLIEVRFRKDISNEGKLLYYDPRTISSLYFGSRVVQCDVDRIIYLFRKQKGLKTEFYRESFNFRGEIVFVPVAIDEDKCVEYKE